MGNVEIWKDIPDYEGLYQVSNFGRVKTLSKFIDNINGKSLRKEKIISICKTKYGYCKVGLTKDKIYKHKLVHRLAALAFIPNSDNKPQVNHINGIKYDNRLENLEWCTVSENQIHAHSSGLIKKTDMRGVNSRGNKLTEENVIEIRTKKLSRKEYMFKFNVSMGCIQNIQDRHNWKHI